MALLVKETDKLTLGQELTVTKSYSIETLLWETPEQWMSNAHITHDQALLLNAPHIKFPSSTLILLPCCLSFKWFWPITCHIAVWT